MVFNILFPRWCVICKKFGSYVCDKCVSEIEFITKRDCFYCGKISHSGKTHIDCERNKDIDGYLSLCFYNNHLSRIISSVKYSLAREVLYEFFLKIPDTHLQEFITVAEQLPEAIIQPIPLHKNKERIRGFNQAYEIAIFFSHITGLPIGNYLKRVKETDAQAGMESKLERYYNTRNAFTMNNIEYIPPTSIILIDDVLTTGNTVKEAIRVLKNNGVRTVHVWTLARD